MADLPAINSLLHVVVDDEISFQSRLLDVEDNLLTIAAPIGKGDVEIPRNGYRFDVFWTGDRTRYLLVAEMAGWTREHPPRWQLLAVREPTRQTRRRYVRGGSGGAVRIKFLEGEPAVFDGWMIDVSEAGVRCRIPCVSDAIVPGRSVLVRLTIGDQSVELEGTILLVRVGESMSDVDVVVTYEPLERDARVIRQHVLQWEIMRRQLECSVGTGRSAA